MASAALDVGVVRTRFSALDTQTALFDAPGGTQVPDSVIEAIGDYLRTSNANLGGAFATSLRSDALVDEAFFGANMTTLNFALTRTLGRTLRAGDEIVVTTLDHDGNVSPWLELAHDLDLAVHVVGVHDDTTLDFADLESKLNDRTRVVAFPLASN